MGIEQFNKVHKLYIFKVFISVLMALLVIYFIIAMTLNYQTRQETIDIVSHQENLILDGVRERITDHLTFITSDLLYVKSEFKSTYTDTNDYDKIADDWLIYSSERKLYRQIRFIDSSGMEKIRINKNDDTFYKVDVSELQDKSDRYYFLESINLPNHTIYYSKIDLNIENGVYTEPYTLEFRLATPVYDNGVSIGIIILNFDIDYTLDKMSYYNETSNGEFYISNSDGHFIYHPNHDYEWGFDLIDRSNYSMNVMYNDVWSQMSENNGQYLTVDGLFSCYRLIADDIINIHDYNFSLSSDALYLITFVSREDNPYLFSSHLFFNMLGITIVDSLLFILTLVLLSCVITLIIYIRLQFLYEQRYFASIDQLTKVFNREYGIDALEETMKKSQNVSVCFIDLNGLKHINDTYGHQTGDDFIKQAINVIKDHISFPDYVFRLGGDEFIIVSQMEPQLLELLWQDILNTYKIINESQKNEFIISVSHGIVKLKNKFKDVNELIAEADKLMYKEKQVYYKENGQN